MMVPNYWGALGWAVPVGVILALAAGIVAWSYFVSGGSGRLRFALATIKMSAFVLLTLCLLEPMNRFTRPEPGANLMLILADDSQSLQIKDKESQLTREQQVQNLLDESSPWMRELENEFDVRRYQFDRRLRPVSSFEQYKADQRGSNLFSNLQLATDRFEGRPSAGVLLITDGNTTEPATTAELMDAIDWTRMPPVYPVVMGRDRPARDLGITRVAITQSNFESAPITITAELMSVGNQGQSICVQLLDHEQKELERKTVERVEDGRSFAVRFQTKPVRRGVNVYHLRAFLKSSETESPEQSEEATLVNNQRTIIVNRGRGPYRVLYVTGRPNWELKFLRRAIQADDEVDMVSLVRIARREAKFTFRGNSGQQSNPIYKGFVNQDDDTAEQHDEPVFLVLDREDESELRDGFPKDAEALFKYDAVVLDDVESKFFSEDQKSLLQKFVSIRGGGLLMLGGQESFGAGEYDRTPIGEMLPVYLDDLPQRPEAGYRLNLTREGWLQPWVRLGSTESSERKRLGSMPMFQTLNIAKSIKPGATVLATVASDSGKQHPALIVQPFGKGRTGALLVGDWWRWHLKTPEDNDDLMKAWRQTLRWLVADVPRRVEAVSESVSDSSQVFSISVDVRNESFQPYDNATVPIEVTTPDGKTLQLTGRGDDESPGRYSTTFATHLPGAYKAVVSPMSEDGQPIEQRETGWVSEPDRDEFRSLVANRDLLEQIARKSGGKVVELDNVDRFAQDLSTEKVPITETRIVPWWHRWTVFTIALALLVMEWGMRRWKGLP